MLEQGTGFVLRTWPLREADLIVSLFTLEHGKIRGVAHGAKRPKSRWGGALEALVEISVHWRAREGQDLVSLSDVSLVRSPYIATGGDRDSPGGEPLGLAATWTLAHVAELVDRSSLERDADERVHRLVRAVVGSLVDGVDPRVVVRYAQAWVLRLHGVLPDLERCADCGGLLGEDGGSWHWSVHGFACPACQARLGVEGPTLLGPDLAWLHATRRAKLADLSVPEPGVERRTGIALRHLLRDFLGGELRGEAFLDEIDRFAAE